ncbi:hypothetical protein DICPUDRAFT_159329 [Dictyostelium purpureum]|uniref:Uncharacterized protein n=1 Tax=Dictyostelium purpureum TaxID=5786 RepID=F1A3U8_DICPU|nr:uncharacterized protein DICPUDRAFT_159329 [Dictyostelium purpureum]EGC29126.1 hypothetical protein DICPUDRAFT_159329 [Dictyostelium purpureum]|eukprot:XP_003294342.1 hypothetical protein DICPUDRAFT_159329 [Dictyostelium purpureum]
MTKAGIMEEMISDAFNIGNEELEEEAELEVNKIMDEILTSGPSVSTTNPLGTEQVEVEEKEDDSELLSRLNALKS